jgi:hypothetical protein
MKISYEISVHGFFRNMIFLIISRGQLPFRFLDKFSYIKEVLNYIIGELNTQLLHKQ